MEFPRFNPRAAAALGGLAAALVLGATPAHAYKVNDQIELNAKLFADWSTGDNDDANDGFHLKRTYIEGRAHLAEGDTIRFTIDQKVEDGNVFVKYAYWQHPIGGGASIKVGQTHTPLLDFDESHFWGYRFVAPAFADRVKAETSSDIGAAVTGKAGDMVDYYVMVHNGEGYNHATDGQGYAVSGRVDVHTAGFHVGVFDHEEKTHGGVQDYDPSRQLVYAFYDSDLFRLGGEYLMADDGDAATVFDSGTGYNVQGRVKVPVGDDTWAFARYDSVDKKDTGTDETFTVVGVAVPLSKGVTVAPNVQITDPGTPGSETNTVYGVKSQFKF
jgi:hypothetical protein